jgi:hypothetical protein
MQVFSKDTIEKVVVFSMVADGEVFYFWSLLQKKWLFSSVGKDGGIWSKYVYFSKYTVEEDSSIFPFKYVTHGGINIFFWWYRRQTW